MRILTATFYPNAGGSNRVLLAAARALADEHEVSIRAPLVEATHPSPAWLSAKPLAGPLAKLWTLPGLAAALAREFAFVRGARPDALYVHDEIALYVYGLIGRTLKIPLIWHVHMTLGSGITANVRDRLCDRRILISRFTGEGSRSRKPSVMIRNPLLSPAPAPAMRVDDARLALVVVGAISPRKNASLAIDVLRVLQDRGREAELTLVGPELDPAYGKALCERAAALRLSNRVTFAGPRPAEEVWREDAVALFPALYENQPLALVEALAGGRAVVTADIPAHREIFEDVGADPGGLCPHDPAAFADAIEATMVPDPERDRIAARTAEVFAPERFADAIRAVFRDLDAASPAC